MAVGVVGDVEGEEGEGEEGVGVMLVWVGVEVGVVDWAIGVVEEEEEGGGRFIPVFIFLFC